MKQIKSIALLLMAMLSVNMMSAAPATVPTVTDLTGAGYDATNRVICLYFDEQVCNDIVWAGSYNEWATGNPAEMLHFEALAGFEGWYVVEVEDASATVQGKPVQLKKDGSFNWDFQSGDVEAWINMAQPGTQTASFEAGYSGEANCTWPTTGAYIYEVAYFKMHNTPCAADKPKHDYTITAYLPEFCDAIAAYADSARVMGGFDNWTNGVYMQPTVDEDFNDCWYAEIKDVEEDTEFKLRFGTDADWKVQVQLNGANMANKAFGETTDIVLHYDGEGYGFAACSAPVARKEFVFVAGEAAASDPALFAITWGKDGSNETVKLANKADDIYTAEILETVDSLVLVRCATGATEIIWDGDGMNVWNQTANYELCDTMSFESWVPETNLFAVTCGAPQPVATKYYAQNNWDSGEWSWLEMSATNKENIYMLDSVVFGGTGINVNTKEEDTDALWFAADAITVLDGLDGLPGPIPPEPRRRDTIPYAPAHSGVVLEAPQLLAGDTIKLYFNAADSTLSAAIVGRPAPAARKEFVLVAGEAADSDPAMFAITWGKDGSNETVKMTQKGEEALYMAEILETVDSVVLVRCASDATEIIWDGEGKNIWNQTANYELCDTMYFESWVPETNLFAVTCEAPQPVELKFYVTGNDALVGAEKAWQADAIEMTDGTYTFPMLAAGEYQLKVTDGTWEHAWGYTELSKTTAVEGLSADVDNNICFTVYTPNDVTVTLSEGHIVTVAGDFTNSTPSDLKALSYEEKAAKYIRNGRLVIIHDGRMYNAQGAMTK